MAKLNLKDLHNGQLVWWIEPGYLPDCFVVDKLRTYTEVQARIVGFDIKPTPEECFAAAQGNDWKLVTHADIMDTPYATGLMETFPKLYEYYVMSSVRVQRTLVDVWHDDMPWAPITIEAEAFDPMLSNVRLFSNERQASRWGETHLSDDKLFSLVQDSEAMVEFNDALSTI